MSDYRRVLIPVDLTPGRQMMAPAVRRIVDTSDAEITLLHVVESQPWLGRAGNTIRLMNELDILAHRKFRGARLTRRIEWGRPADCILNVLRTDRLDFVLMTSGGSSLSGDPLGPVASEVITEATCPVLLEWAITAPVNQARAQPVCCAVELDGNEARVLREAAWAARRCAAALILLCPFTVAGARAAALLEPEAREREVARVRQRVEELRDRFAPGAAIQVEAGHPSSVVSRGLRLHGAGLLVAGGSRESLLAAESQCPVLYIGAARERYSARPEALEQYEFAIGRSA
jgi:nucleotide-binding universal stress UspA family protein